jgi:spermidine synthase
MLVLVVGASTQAFELMLAAFILGLALGGLWVRNHVDRFRDLIGALAIVQVLMGIAALATLPVYDSTFDFLGWLIRTLRRTDGGYLVYNLASHGIAIAVMLPATFLAGMTLPLITTALLKTPLGERAVGYVYAANTLGAILGVILAVHFALPVLGLKHGLMLGAAIDIALGVALMLRGRTLLPRNAIVAWSSAGLIGLVAAQLFVSVPAERSAAGVFRHGVARVEPGTSIVYHEDGKTATVTVTKRDQIVSIRTNGKPDAAADLDPAASAVGDEYTMALAAILPLAWHPQAKTAAIVGFGSGITTATMLASPRLERVDTIEIEPRMVDGARHFGTLVAAAYSDPRSNVVIDDAKSYFARSRHKYDVIASEPSNPWVSGVSSLFTAEWYSQVHRQLADDGLLIQWLQIYEFSDDLTWMVLRALDSVFADYRIYAANDGDLVIVAAKRPIGTRPASDFLAWTGLQSQLARLDFNSVDEIESRFIASRATIRPLLAAGSAVNSDYFPIVDHHAPRARFLGAAATFLPRLGTANVPVVEMIEVRDPLSLPRDLGPSKAPDSRRASFATAEAVTEFMLRGTSPQDGAVPADVGLLRAALWDCASIPASVDPSAAIVKMAALVNPYLRPEAARMLWTATRGARCANRLTPAEVRWLELAAAVGDRSAATMASLGTDLARADNVSPALRAYAVTAGATGLLAQGRAHEAKALLEEVRAKLPDRGQGDAALVTLAAVAVDRSKGR